MKKRTLAEVLTALQAPGNKSLPLELIEEALVALESKNTFASAFVREAMRAAPRDEEGRRAHWRQTIVALSKAGRQYSVGDEAFRATLTMFVSSPWLLAACQAGTVAASMPVVVAAALAKDGSEASRDALMLEFHRAVNAEDRWGLQYKLKRLGRYATKNAAWCSFENAVAGALNARDEVLVQNSFAKELGLRVKLLTLSMQVDGFETGQGPAWLWLRIDDKQQTIDLQSTPNRSFASPKSALEIPGLIAEVTRRHSLLFRWSEARTRSSLRGKNLEALVAWVRGLRESPLPD